MKNREIKNEPKRRISRRSFMIGTGTATLVAGGLHKAIPFFGGEAQAAQQEELKMIRLQDRPLNLETPRQALSSWLTPTDLFYVRSHYNNPDVNLAKWRIAIGGEVNHQEDLNLSSIQRLPKVNIICPLECTGNGRSYFKPQTRGNQWQVGSVSNAVWSGARLSDVLKETGIRSSGKYITFKGGEKRPQKTAAQFIRSVPLEKAMKEVILAYEMNGKPLTPDHGYPLRAIMPGWYGPSSVKWLEAIAVTAEPDPGRFQQSSYRLVREGQEVEQAEYTNVMNVKSVIAQPGPGTIHVGTIPVQGVAWTGKGEITRVEFSTDEGRTWHETELTGLTLPYSWQTWFYLWNAKPGTHRLASRATDSAGRTQPMQSLWNKNGYCNNGVIDHAFQITVA